MLYKYRKLNKFKWIEDIIQNNRLHTDVYTELNDPMEGIFKHKKLPKEIVAEIIREKEALRICSLSKKYDEALMLAHYSDGERGIVIGINDKILKSNYTVHEINYDGIKDDVTKETPIVEILSCKNSEWRYEQEVRVFSKKEYIDIVIEEIIMGSRISLEHEKKIELLVKVNPHIKIRKLDNALTRVRNRKG